MSFTDRELKEAFPALKRFCRSRTRDADKGDDLAQSTIERALERKETFDPRRGDLTGWLCTIARNKWADQCRSLERAHLVATSEDQYEAALAGHATRGNEQETYFDAQRAINQIALLPEDQRQVMFLHAIDGMSQNEISKHLGMPLGTVKSNMRLARKKLSGGSGAFGQAASVGSDVDVTDNASMRKEETLATIPVKTQVFLETA